MNASLRRTARKYKVVNYTGMDTIEPECEFDGITDIWYDETIHYDPDYVFEEDYDDDDEDTELDDEDQETMTPRRTLRNYKVINYTGMDTIEPECEFDYITDIWHDETIHSDPDYTP